MRKPLKLIAAALFSRLFLSACWDMQDIENQNIVTAVIVDKTETGYALYIEVAAIGDDPRVRRRPGNPRKTSLSAARAKLTKAPEKTWKTNRTKPFLSAACKA